MKRHINVCNILENFKNLYDCGYFLAYSILDKGGIKKRGGKERKEGGKIERKEGGKIGHTVYYERVYSAKKKLQKL